MYAVRNLEPVFAGVYEMERAQPLLAGLDRGDYLTLNGLDKSDYLSLRGVYDVEPGQPLFAGAGGGLGEISGGGVAAVGVVALVFSAVVSFGLMVLASYTGNRIAGCTKRA